MAEGSAPEAAESESTPLLRSQSSRRTDAAEQVHQRLVQEVYEFVSTYKVWLVILVLFLICLVLTMLVFFVQAISATIYYQDKPCDQPLKWYMLVSLVWSQVVNFVPSISYFIRQRVDGGPITSMLVRCGCSIPGFLIIAYGVYMIQFAKTCPKTNPELYFPLRRFIYGSLVVAIIALAFTIFGLFSLRRILLMLNQLSVQPGCEEAVRKLPKVDRESPELIDPEDGTVIDCSICMEALGSDLRSVVRAPCSHLHHEECLATWCKNHTDCPMCRQPVGEPEGEEKVGEDAV